MRYKNLFFAFSIEIFFGLFTSILIIVLGFKAIAFLSLFALRPFILEKERISAQDEFWYKYFQLGKNSLIIFAVLIILVSLFVEFFVHNNFLYENKDRVLHLLIPLYIMIHGLVGVLSLNNNSLK
ncbi:MAG: hypothetical protein HYS25_15050 [Ignavibacteriales bacterium]|nr:hypothetical protein [Ignavibacteriales bacterium]